jgi:alkanesulfonate monooxygenase SsuD/methylene tetrahydromethanopterin reductase-like flavin-dependent oxidoreductase (luciferase family)
MAQIRVGVTPPIGIGSDAAEQRDFLERVDESPIDHVFYGDHVSFFTGAGNDGLLTAAAMLAVTNRVSVHTAVYLLPLRHPVPVARQLADLARLAPERFVFGVGVGGEDPHEFQVCGVDPRTRGRRMDESLDVVRSLLDGRSTTFHGEFFQLDDASIAPSPSHPIPIVIGGRSDAALHRVAHRGDGWLGIWNSPARFARAATTIADEAERIGRSIPWRHGMQVWCGIDTSPATARPALASAMEGFYMLPFERFEKYSPYGTPEDIASFLRGYVEAGCRSFNLIPVGPDPKTALDAVVDVRELLNSGAPRPEGT